MRRWLLDVAVTAGRLVRVRRRRGGRERRPAARLLAGNLESAEGAAGWPAGRGRELAGVRCGWPPPTVTTRGVVEVAEALHRFANHWVSWPGWGAVFTMARAAARALGDRAQEAAQLNHLAWGGGRSVIAGTSGASSMPWMPSRIAAEAGDVRQQGLGPGQTPPTANREARRCRALRGSRRPGSGAGPASRRPGGILTGPARLGDGLHGLGRPGEAMDVRLRLAALLTTPGNGIHPELRRSRWPASTSSSAACYAAPGTLGTGGGLLRDGGAPAAGT